MTTPAPPSHKVTQLLLDWRGGNQAAFEKLMPLVYRELRRLAHQYLRKERKGHTLQTTDLVHEAYLKLVDQRRVQWRNRAHFYAIAAQLMRRILVDRARRRRRVKRGAGASVISLHNDEVASRQSSIDVLAIDEALTRLEQVDPRKAQIVELRFFRRIGSK